MDGELRWDLVMVQFDLVRRAVIQGGVPKVEVKVSVEVVGYIQSGFFETGKRAVVEQQFNFERAPARFGLDVIIGVAQSAEAGQYLAWAMCVRPTKLMY